MDVQVLTRELRFQRGLLRRAYINPESGGRACKSVRIFPVGVAQGKGNVYKQLFTLLLTTSPTLLVKCRARNHILSPHPSVVYPWTWTLHLLSHLPFCMVF